jgi:DNA-binding HxlR family transcriptional regulator
MSGKWYHGYSPGKREEIARREIYALIPKDSEIQWKELRKLAKQKGISSATLSRHLKKGVKDDVIQRRVDESTYPPKVYYRYNVNALSPNIIIEPLKQLDYIEEALKKGKVEKEEANKIRGIIVPTYLKWLTSQIPQLFYFSLATYPGRELFMFERKLDHLINDFIKPLAMQLLRICLLSEKISGVRVYPLLPPPEIELKKFLQIIHINTEEHSKQKLENTEKP